MEPNSQMYIRVMIPVSGSDSSQQTIFPSFFPSFLPTWSSMRAGPSIESPPSSGISEVSPEPPMSDDDSDSEMSVVKPLARRVCAFLPGLQ